MQHGVIGTGVEAMSSRFQQFVRFDQSQVWTLSPAHCTRDKCFSAWSSKWFIESKSLITCHLPV